jgi:hypothetical protein
MKRVFMKGYGQTGIFFMHNRINGCREFIFTNHCITDEYKINVTDRWNEKLREWINPLNYVETRKNKIYRR